MSGHLGAHVSAAGGIPAAPPRAGAIQATAMQIFTKQANRWAERECDDLERDDFRAGLAKHGVEVTNMPMFKRARRGMGYLSQEPSIFQRLTVRQNILAIMETMSLPGRVRRERCDQLLEQFGLTRLRSQLARTLSGGERRKLEIARALVTNPTMILLDEPFSGVDPIAVEELQKEIVGLRDRGISILLTDHNVRETLSVTDRSYIIDNGKVLREGAPKTLINDELVRRTYLGQTFRGDEFGE